MAFVAAVPLSALSYPRRWGTAPFGVGGGGDVEAQMPMIRARPAYIGLAGQGKSG